MLENFTPNSIVLGPRPGKKSFARLDEMNLTHCCTLLGEREDPNPIKKICKKLDCEWLWLPIEGGNQEALRTTDLAGHVRALDAVMKEVENPKIYLHCSAGIHRTGFFAYILLRVSGLDPDKALASLSDLRTVTSTQVGDERIALAETLLEGGLLIELSKV